MPPTPSGTPSATATYVPLVPGMSRVWRSEAPARQTVIAGRDSGFNRATYSGPATSATISPGRLLGDFANGKLYFVDSYSTVRVLTRNMSTDSWDLTLFAGNGTRGTHGDGGPATSATFWGVSSMAKWGQAILVADAGGAAYGNVIRAVWENGTIDGLIGTYGSGNVKGDGVGRAATFNNIGEMAWHPDGSLLVQEGSYIRRVDMATLAVTTLAGNGGTTYTDGAVLSAMAAFALSGLAVSPAGNIYTMNRGAASLIRLVMTLDEPNPVQLSVDRYCFCSRRAPPASLSLSFALSWPMQARQHARLARRW